jgi:hypothetical protein
MVDVRNTFKLYGNIEWGGAFELQILHWAPWWLLEQKFFDFSRPITCASVCQFQPLPSPYLYNCHLIQRSVTSPHVISLLNNITIDNAFCISQHFTEFHSKSSLQIRLRLHCSESGASRFVWKVVNYTFHRTAGHHIFKYRNSKTFYFNIGIFVSIFYISKIYDVIKLCFHTSCVHSFIDQFLTTLSLVSWNDIVSVIVTSDECATKLSTHRHRIWLHKRKSQDESCFWFDKMAPFYRVQYTVVVVKSHTYEFLKRTGLFGVYLILPSVL